MLTAEGVVLPATHAQWTENQAVVRDTFLLQTVFEVCADCKREALVVSCFVGFGHPGHPEKLFRTSITTLMRGIVVENHNMGAHATMGEAASMHEGLCGRLVNTLAEVRADHRSQFHSGG